MINELSILDWIQTLHNPILDQIMVFITRLGNAGAIWILLTVVLILIPKTRKTGVIAAFVLIVDVLLCDITLKNIVGRIRPYDVNTGVHLLISKPHGWSFPSGHTSASFAVVTALYLAREKKLWKPVLILALLIAISRMYLYVHYPTDIFGGIVVGIVSGYLGYELVKKIHIREHTHYFPDATK